MLKIPAFYRDFMLFGAVPLTKVLNWDFLSFWEKCPISGIFPIFSV